MHLNTHTCFSLRYGTLSVEQLIDAALEKGLDSLALTDINNTSAGLDFVMKARAKGLRPVLGIEFREEGRLCYIGLAANAEGWRQLCEFLSAHLHRSAQALPGQAAIRPDKRKRSHMRDEQAAWDSDEAAVFAAHGPGSVLPGPMRRLHFPARAPELPDVSFVYPFGQAPDPSSLRVDEYIGVRPGDLNRLHTAPCRHFPQRLVAWSPVTFLDKVGYNTHRLLRAIDRNILLSRQEAADLAAPDETMRSLEEMLQLYQQHPQLLTNALRLLDRCAFELEFGAPRNKVSFTSSRYDDRLLLEKLAWDGCWQRYGHDNAEAKRRVTKELDVIDRLGFSAYFLITWDFIRYGQARGFFHVGRGSGANSIVAYCMGITDVDPIDLDLYFERFLNPHRTSPPDFDIDFSWTDRDDVIDYVFKRYGNTCTTLMATYNTFQGRSIIRELGKVFGLPKEEIDGLVANRHSPQLDDKVVRLIYRYGKELEGLPNHLGIHPGGILISEAPIRSYAATELPPKGFPIVQFDMFVAEEAGLYKFDVLSQRGLGHIKDAALTVHANCGRSVDVHAIQYFKDDPKIADLLRTGDTIGCFYVESPAMRQLLKKLRCDDYVTLVAASSVIRPGVARSGMMKQYIERHRMHTGLAPTPAGQGRESWFMHPRMGEILAETYGVMVYQEDVIKVAHHFGGVDLGEADILRRAMSGKFRSRSQFDQLRDKFFANCRDKGYPEHLTAEVWRQMESFSGYSFCKAHSASFAVESYQSLFFKAHYPREFMVGVINNFGGFYRTEIYLHEARRAGAVVHAACINRSEFLTRIEGLDLWLGFVHVTGLAHDISEAIVAERVAGGPFVDLGDLLRRVELGLDQAMVLIRVGALRAFGKLKKQLLWEVNMRFAKAPVRVQKSALFGIEEKTWQMPALPDHPVEDAYDALELYGFFLPPPEGPAEDGAVMPPAFGLLTEPVPPTELRARDLPGQIGRTVQITGYLVTTKQVRTVKGDMMGFSDFIDVRGDAFDGTLFPDVFRQQPFGGIGIYRLTGRVAYDFGVPSLEVARVERLGYQGDPRRA
jgi:DNA polymerase III alpha subunit